MMILGGGGSFPYYELGGLWKISNENYIERRGGGGGQPIFSRKRK